nr:MAG TPA: exo-alpha-sialidase [Caudoviricetes sp.]DAW19935.1 MAG TPA: exo-alpha-sialidase [Caudoviricetes sp.]
MAAWNRVLTDDEIAAQYNQIRNHCLNVHGIAV